MRSRWTDSARASLWRFARDQEGVRAVITAVLALELDPYPAEGFHRGEYHRIRAGKYRIQYFTENDVITIVRVDRADEP